MRPLAPQRSLPKLPTPQSTDFGLWPPILLRHAAAVATAAGSGAKGGDEVVVGVLGLDFELHCLELAGHVVLAKGAAAGVDWH